MTIPQRAASHFDWRLTLGSRLDCGNTSWASNPDTSLLRSVGGQRKGKPMDVLLGSWGDALILASATAWIGYLFGGKQSAIERGVRVMRRPPSH
jgi:hypothetical protein